MTGTRRTARKTSSGRADWTTFYAATEFPAGDPNVQENCLCAAERTPGAPGQHVARAPAPRSKTGQNFRYTLFTLWAYIRVCFSDYAKKCLNWL